MCTTTDTTHVDYLCVDPELVEQVELCVHEELRGRNERRQRQVEDLMKHRHSDTTAPDS